MKRIYLAAPYTHDNPKIREHRFILVNDVAALLMKMGHLVFSPISHSHPIAVQCGLPKGWDFWEASDLAFIEWCHELYILTIDGWEKSRGIKKEIAYCKSMRKPISLIDIEGNCRLFGCNGEAD